MGQKITAKLLRVTLLDDTGRYYKIHPQRRTVAIPQSPALYRQYF